MNNVDQAFRNMLQGIAPPSVPMNGCNASSTGVLTGAAEAICATDDHRKLLQMVYQLGVSDGELKALKTAIEKMERAA